MERRKTSQITVGDIAIGGFAPISIQSMTSGYTHDIDSCVAEINRLYEAGADIVRVAVPQKIDTEALPEILNQVQVPIVADVHFHYERALESIASGVHKIRLNPGNIDDETQVHKVIDACKEAKIPIRVGVNEGSIVERKNNQKRQAQLASFFADRNQGHLLAMMIAKLEEYEELFKKRDFYDLCLSAKLMDASLVIDIYQEISKRFDYPLHLGVTHAGPRETGSIRSVAAIGSLLSSGIGDTIRISYASDPVYEVEDAVELLNCLHLRERIGAELIACPSCGRIQVDLFTLVKDVQAQLADEIELPIKVAVMGCVVNGPGEAEGADVAVFAGDRRGIIYVQGKRVANVSEDEILHRLLDECRSLQDRVRSGETKLGEKVVSIIPPQELTVEGDAH
ncbi:MAG: flavodoxin-dependent (E)-4-hydroxy-3-methylbut-2-enyl-diphosphate synthase [Phycisphaerales bacterium]|nr:flavodoxin-dependent (E)-4-hydroxy-3-methylbut-2-enyl-diphosphate synthase [Phycisphaerales bacterium]